MNKMVQISDLAALRISCLEAFNSKESEDVFSLVDTGTKRFNNVRINCVQLQHTASEIVADVTKSQDELGSARSRLPLKFPDQESEISAMAVMNLLDCGRNFESLLLDITKRSLVDTLIYGIMSIHLSGTKLDTDFMLNVNVAQISQLFSFPAVVEQKIMHGVYQDANGPLFPLAEKFVKIMKETGRILKSMQMDNLGEFILKTVRKHSKYKKSAAGITQALSEIFPAFKDEATITISVNEVESDNSRKFLFARKAQQLTLDLYSRFSAVEEDFKFEDMKECTAFADSNLVCILRNLKIIEVDDELKDCIDKEKKEFTAGSVNETSLRIAGIACVEYLSQLIKGQCIPEDKKGQVDLPVFVDSLLRFKYSCAHPEILPHRAETNCY